MKTSVQLTATMLGIAMASSLALAQEVRQEAGQETGQGVHQENSHGGSDQVHETLVPQPEGTALINAPVSISLDQLAVNRPAELTGIPITDATGNAVGEVERIARRTSDNVLHAVVRTEDGPLAATVLAELNVGAFALWNPEGLALSETDYQPADFELVDQHQAGHSAWGSLSEPSGETLRYPQYSRLPGAADQQVQADAVLQQEGEPMAESGRLPGQSSITQMALTQSDRMKGIVLLNGAGDELGVIAEIVRNTRDGLLYALINTAADFSPALVSLEELKVGRLVFGDEDVNLQDQAFEEINFREVETR